MENSIDDIIQEINDLKEKAEAYRMQVNQRSAADELSSKFDALEKDIVDKRKKIRKAYLDSVAENKKEKMESVLKNFGLKDDADYVTMEMKDLFEDFKIFCINENCVNDEMMHEASLSLDNEEKNKLIENINLNVPDVAEQVRKTMFLFNDIVILDDRAIQKFMREVDSQELALALKDAEDDVQEKIFRNMSERASNMLKEDMEFMGPCKIEQINYARSCICSVINRLAESGEIVIPERDGLI